MIILEKEAKMSAEAVDNMKQSDLNIKNPELLKLLFPDALIVPEQPTSSSSIDSENIVNNVENNKKYLVVHYLKSDVPNYADYHTLLKRILTSIHIKDHDYQELSLQDQADSDILQLLDQLHPEFCLYFANESGNSPLPEGLKFNELTKINGISILACESLQQLQHSREKKLALWAELKKINLS